MVSVHKKIHLHFKEIGEEIKEKEVTDLVLGVVYTERLCIDLASQRPY